MEAAAKADQLFGLLSHFLKLLIDYRSVEAIDGDVKPVSFFAFHDEVQQDLSALGA